MAGPPVPSIAAARPGNRTRDQARIVGSDRRAPALRPPCHESTGVDEPSLPTFLAPTDGFVHRHLGPVPVAGFFGNGELGPVRSQTFLHAYTSAFALVRSVGGH